MSARAGLERFVEAQEVSGAYERALAELRAGRKGSHWMWFVFPQVAGLGRSATARYFAIADLAEARAYLAHPVLGPRLAEAARAVLDSPTRDAGALLGGIDALKLASSMTLFEAAGGEATCAAVLDRFYGGRRDEATLRLLGLSEDGSDAPGA